MGTGGVRRLAGRINAQLALAPRISLEQRLWLGQTVGIGIVAVVVLILCSDKRVAWNLCLAETFLLSAVNRRQLVQGFYHTKSFPPRSIP